MENTLFTQVETSTLGGEFLAGYQGTLNRKQDLKQSFINVGESAIKPKILKVAAYCRVSTLSDMQEDSLENQAIHYTRHIRSNTDWYFTGIYSDRGKTGTKIDSRSGFKRLIRHALQGKVDLILCKSISRFARNVVDTLNMIRILKENNVQVIFEKENIDTNTMQSEFIVTLLAAVAQEESRSSSENLNWSNAKRFEQGEPTFTRMLGYKKDDKRAWIVVRDEAETVKEAFDLYARGISPTQISRLFISEGYKKANGRDDWSGTSIRDILKNERYTGDALCQKTYTQDYLTHKSIRNDGIKSQYLVKNHHEAIIDMDTFDKTQDILLRRSRIGGSGKKKSYPLSGRLICGECGSNLQHFKCRGVVTWRCGFSVKSKALCTMTGIKEDKLKEAMVKAFYQRYKLSDSLSHRFGKLPIKEMMKDLKNAQVSGDIEYNKLRLDLERVLFEENMVILKGEDSEGNKNAELLKIRRQKIEAEIKEKEKWWDILENDNGYRASALEKLEILSRRSMALSGLKKHLENDKCIEFLRAWVVRIKALSPILFSITWISGDNTYVEISEGDNEAWMKIIPTQVVNHQQHLSI